MAKIIYNKLVRDKIPDIIRADNQTPVVTVLDEASYKKELLKKLVEEASELLESNGDIGERVDVAEVLRAIDAVFNLTQDRIELLRVKKQNKRGGFERKLFLKEAILNG